MRCLIRQRRKRASLFGADLFSDPAWDMLLDLAAARLENERVSVSSLCLASGAPQTTALRWIAMLQDAGLVARRADPLDGRRAYIELTEKAITAMGRHFEEAEVEFGMSC
ncbi:MAG: winged helix DNA-binding protein [Sphingomonadales bacterium]